MLEQQFKQRYLESLSFFKYFYDDVREYGSPDNPRRVFYFIPGFSGVAGQVRFIFPNLHALYGNNFYVRPFGRVFGVKADLGEVHHRQS